MNVHELRIGNYVGLTKDGAKNLLDTCGEVIEESNTHIVKWIYKDEVGVNIKDYGGFDFDLDELSPITLTEELLLRFGFEKALNGWWDESEQFSIKDGYFCVGVDPVIKCLYVHQLQNIYFALTGKELV